MESATKNRQSRGTVETMAAAAFPGLRAVEILELGEGYFNAAYCVRLSDGRDVILKIAPPDGVPVMTYERDIMSAEVAGMRLVREKTDLPVPEVLCYDGSRALCPSAYFFMEKLAGQSFSAASAGMTAEQRGAVQLQCGRINRTLNDITGDGFGSFVHPEERRKEWFLVFAEMLEDIFLDAKRMGISLAVRDREVRSLLSDFRRVFDEVTVPRFVHWDLWAGNVFTENGKVTGIIDFERCLWADALMEAGFRAGARDASFLRGYGQTTFSGAEKLRMTWYDLYLYLIMSMESECRRYGTLDQKVWANKMVLESLACLKKARIS